MCTNYGTVFIQCDTANIKDRKSSYLRCFTDIREDYSSNYIYCHYCGNKLKIEDHRITKGGQ